VALALGEGSMGEDGMGWDWLVSDLDLKMRPRMVRGVRSVGGFV
jgi:hypothetical protein